MGSRIDRRIAEFLPARLKTENLEKYLGKPSWIYDRQSHQEMIADPVWDLLSRRGKRWRPLFALLLLDALGTSSEPYETLVATLAELSHSGSLIIDDIQDSSLMRRGRESIHVLYGENTAICAANTLYFLSTRLLFEHPLLAENQRLKIIEVIMKQYTRAHFGQAQDLYWSTNLTEDNLESWLDDSLESKILQMYELKTASLVEGLAESSCIINGADSITREACYSYARALGVAFQVMDDIHGLDSNPGGKKEPAEDISEGKLTYPFCRSLKILDRRDSSKLKKILTSPEMRGKIEFRDEAAELIRNSGSLSACREEVISMVTASWDELSDHLESSHAKIMLRMLNNRLLQLKYKSDQKKEQDNFATRPGNTCDKCSPL